MGVNEHQKSISVNGVGISWNTQTVDLRFFGIPSTLFWNNPSLLHLLQPLEQELGRELFNLLVAHSSSLGTEEDYHAMVTQFSDNFEEGFLLWGKAVSAAGWGLFELPYMDAETTNAEVIVRNPWELSMQKELPDEERWGCPFLQGKIIGIFTHAFGRQCWADQELVYDILEPYVRFRIYAHDDTIYDKLQELRRQNRQIKD